MIDWDKVREARRRGKLGRMRPGDQELVEAAMRDDPERYRGMSAEVIAEVTEEMRSFGRWEQEP